MTDINQNPNFIIKLNILLLGNNNFSLLKSLGSIIPIKKKSKENLGTTFIRASNDEKNPGVRRFLRFEEKESGGRGRRRDRKGLLGGRERE